MTPLVIQQRIDRAPGTAIRARLAPLLCKDARDAGRTRVPRKNRRRTRGKKVPSKKGEPWLSPRPAQKISPELTPSLRQVDRRQGLGVNSGAFLGLAWRARALLKAPSKPRVLRRFWNSRSGSERPLSL